MVSAKVSVKPPCQVKTQYQYRYPKLQRKSCLPDGNRQAEPVSIQGTAKKVCQTSKPKSSLRSSTNLSLKHQCMPFFHWFYAATTLGDACNICNGRSACDRAAQQRDNSWHISAYTLWLWLYGCCFLFRPTSASAKTSTHLPANTAARLPIHMVDRLLNGRSPSPESPSRRRSKGRPPPAPRTPAPANPSMSFHLGANFRCPAATQQLRMVHQKLQMHTRTGTIHCKTWMVSHAME